MADGPLLAVVVRSGHAPLSRRASPLVEVLSGRLARGDEVQLVRRGGTETPVRVRSLTGGSATALDEDRTVALDGVEVDECEPGCVLRRPGEQGVTLENGGSHAAPRRRLRDAVRDARATGLTGPDAELLALLTDEGAVLHVERRVRRALARHTSPFDLREDLQAAASALETIGLREDADRLRVTAAAALEGCRVAPSSAALADAATLGALTVSDAAALVSARGRGLGALLDLDLIEGLASGYGGSCESAGRQIRLDLQADDRAVALGWCRRCRDVTRLDSALRCMRDGKKVRDPVLVVPADLAVTEAWLRRQPQSAH